MVVCQKFASSIKSYWFFIMCKKWIFKALFIILRYREIQKFLKVSVKFAEISKLVLYLDFQIRQNQKNKLKEKNDEYELKNMSYKNTRKYNYVAIKMRR